MSPWRERRMTFKAGREFPQKGPRAAAARDAADVHREG